jgi:hypothetical protein
MLRELLQECVDRTGRVIVLASVVLGALAGLVLYQFAHVSEGFWENAGVWSFFGAFVAFMVDLLFITPLRLLKRERKQRRDQASTVFAGPVTVGQMYVSSQVHAATGQGAAHGLRPDPSIGRPPWIDLADIGRGVLRDVALRLVDLVPLEGSPVVAGRRFERCWFYGPGIIAANASTFHGVDWDSGGGTDDAVLYAFTPEQLELKVVVGPVLFAQCELIDCHFVQIGFINNPQGLAEVRRAIAVTRGQRELSDG